MNYRSLNLEQEARERESEKERNKLLGIATPASSNDNSTYKGGSLVILVMNITFV